MTSTPPAGPAAGPVTGSDSQAPGPTWPTDQPAPMGTGPRVTADQVRDLGRLRRVTVDRKIAGVAGGVARHLDIDPLVVRTAFVVLSLFGGAGIVLYAAGWILLPEDGEQRQPLGLDERSRSVALILAGVLSAALLVGQWDWFWVPGPLILVALVVWLVVSRRTESAAASAAAVPTAPVAPQAPPPGAGPNAVTPEQRWGAATTVATPPVAPTAGPVVPAYQPSPAYDRTPPPPARYVPPPAPRNPRKRGPKLFWFTMALAALAVGVVGVVDVSGAPVPGSLYPAVVVAVVGLMLVVGSFFGRAGGLILVGLLAAAVTGIGVASEKWDGDQVEIVPDTAGQVQDAYTYDVGQYTLDLSLLSDPENLDGKTIEMSVDVGELDVVLPRGVDVDVTSAVNGPGGSSLFGKDSGGIDSTDSATYRSGDADAPHLTLDLQVDVGHIDVRTR